MSITPRPRTPEGTHLLLCGVDVGVSVVDVAHLILEVELGALGEARLLLWGGQSGGDSCRSEGQGAGQEVVVKEIVAIVTIVAEVTKASIWVVVAWLVTSEPWIVAS